MSEQDPIRVFVTHAFDEHEEYSRVFEYLESRDNFFYTNCSQPDVAAGDSAAMQEEIRRQIHASEAVVFPMGIYNINPALFEFELTVAQAFDKPVIAIKAFGDTLTIPAKLLEAAVETVEWNDRDITDALRRHGRGEDVAQWDVVDFDPDDFNTD